MAVDIREIWQNDGFHASDTDTNSAVHYYGYQNAKGEWYVMQETATASGYSYRFSRGFTGYSTAWTGRAGLTYDYYAVVFV